MPRNIVVCCDGTANEFSAHRTNVVKLYFALVKDGPDQACWYHPGVGTMAPPGFVTQAGSRVAELLGLAFGYGLTADVRDAYVFIADNYRPGDRLFLFGFSRGAYTVRAVASLLHMYGLIGRGNEPLAPYIVRMLWAIHALRARERPGRAPDPRIAAYFELAAMFKQTFSSECRPHFVGVWDTVSSVGWFTSPLALPYSANNGDVAIARHAVSIDERRAFFRPNLFVPRPGDDCGPRDLRQVWFPGVHADVGGGYAEAESGLSKFPLQWMLEEAVAAGLVVDTAKVARVLGAPGGGYAPPDPDGMLHDSLRGWWKLLEHVPKPHWDSVARQQGWRANLGRRRVLPPRAVVHDAAWAREGGAYAAAWLPADAVKLSEARWDESPCAG